MATCRDCKLFDLEAAKDKAGRVRSDRVVRCFWESKEKYPSSVGCWVKRHVGGWTSAKDGNDCPCFKKRVKK